MIAFISLIYASFYFLVFGKGIVKKNARNMSIFVGIGVVLVGGIIFAWLTVAPTTKDGRVFQYVIPIVPNVSGQVIEVPVEPIVHIDEGDVLKGAEVASALDHRANWRVDSWGRRS